MDRPDTRRIFGIETEKEFSDLALEIFRYQASENPVYKKYLELLGRPPGPVEKVEDIPFLPIEFFRKHKVLTGKAVEEAHDPEITKRWCVFESSGTTSDARGKHYVSDIRLYSESFIRGFERVYGDPNDYCILALLPSYREQQNSSLVFMVDHLMHLSGKSSGGFFLDDHATLVRTLESQERMGQKTILLGVSFALLDLAEKHSMKLKHTIVVETGGMKGRRKEITRQELHAYLGIRFGVHTIHSEYGMTELLSQAWSRGNGVFQCPPWMKIFLRDPYDPLSPQIRNTSGGINIIDLANINSCCFIATQDIGRSIPTKGIAILGRFDHSEIRGCNLLVN